MKPAPILVFLFFILSTFSIKAQDLNFTQFYASPLYMNPAFTGLTEQYRVTAAYRNHWVQLPEGFVSNFVSFDHNLLNQNSGIGASITHDKVRNFGYSSTNFSASYAYNFMLRQGWHVRMGLQAGYTRRSVNFSSFTFAEEGENLPNTQAGFFDISMGGLVYNKNYWLGVALKHVNEPEQQYEGGGSFEVPAHLSIHGGTRIYLRQLSANSHISPAIIYQKQGDFQQMDIGTNVTYHVLMVGLWYRGIPLGTDASSESIAMVTGVNLGATTLGYSYDFNISGVQAEFGGSHEITLMFQPKATLKFKRSAKGKRFVECPASYGFGR